jgi:hypothetical protein
VYHATHLGIRVLSEWLQERSQSEPARRGGSQDYAATNAPIRVGDPPSYVRFEAGRIAFEQVAKRLVRRRPHLRLGGAQPRSDHVERVRIAAPSQTKERIRAGLRVIDG